MGIYSPRALFDTFELPLRHGIKVTSVRFLAKLTLQYCMVCVCVCVLHRSSDVISLHV